jgi:hypothetical protein
LDGPLPKWCPAVALSHQDGRHSAVALLLKAALIQVSDYRLLGASGLLKAVFVQFEQVLVSHYFYHYSQACYVVSYNPIQKKVFVDCN